MPEENNKERRPAPLDEIPFLAEGKELGAKATAWAKGFGKRIFVHVAAAACGAVVAASSGSVVAGVCVYAGGICFAARGMGMNPGWLVPAGFGAAQTVALVVMGVPWPQAFFWGGAQIWAQRFLYRRSAMGGEWMALLLLLPVGIFILGRALSPGMTAASFGGFFLAGLGLAFLRRRRAAAKQAALQGPPEPERVVAHRAALASLRGRIDDLPQNMRGTITSIAASTDAILECMAKDPRDLEPGHRFLNRYLKAVRSLTDKHICLARENVITPEIIEALAQSEDMLNRLDRAFAEEYARLLANDAADFSADLGVLDALLKMDGK